MKGLERLDPVTMAGICSFVAKMRDARETPAIELELIAPEGSGKRTLAAQVCASFGRDLLVVDARTVVPSDLSFPQRSERMIRAARMAGERRGAVLESRRVAELACSPGRSRLVRARFLRKRHPGRA